MIRFLFIGFLCRNDSENVMVRLTQARSVILMLNDFITIRLNLCDQLANNGIIDKYAEFFLFRARGTKAKTGKNKFLLLLFVEPMTIVGEFPQLHSPFVEWRDRPLSDFLLLLPLYFIILGSWFFHFDAGLIQSINMMVRV